MTTYEKTIVSIGVLIVVVLGVSTLQNIKEYKIKEETYISSLQQAYDSNVEACREAVNKANETASDEDKKKAVKTTCIDSINSKSREANLLKDRGYFSLLKNE